MVSIKDLADEPHCENCNSRLLTVLYHSQDANKLKADLQKRREDKELTPEEQRIKQLPTQSRPDTELRETGGPRVAGERGGS